MFAFIQLQLFGTGYFKLQKTEKQQQSFSLDWVSEMNSRVINRICKWIIQTSFVNCIVHWKKKYSLMQKKKCYVAYQDFQWNIMTWGWKMMTDFFIFGWLFFKAEYQTVSDVRVSNQRRTNCLLNVEPACLLTTLVQ